jgi:hypothetical protein
LLEAAGMPKNNKSIVVLASISCAIIFVIILTVYSFFPDAFVFPQSKNRSSNLEISNLQMEPAFNWLGSNIKLTVTNTHNSPITVIGSRINGLNFEYSKLEIPPGQTKNDIVPLNNLKINNSTSYYTQLTFTFDDGQYEVYSANITPTKYVSAFIITGQSLNATSNTTTYSVTIQNTGNIPLLKIKCVIDNYESLQTLKQSLIPKSTATLNFTVPLTPQKGSTYIVTLEATFAEESTFSATTSYIFS